MTYRKGQVGLELVVVILLAFATFAVAAEFNAGEWSNWMSAYDRDGISIDYRERRDGWGCA